MMPEEWPSMRSMARWVLPVLVGPRTAVTPRARIGGGSTVGIIKGNGSRWLGVVEQGETAKRPCLERNMGLFRARVNPPNAHGTERARIGARAIFVIRSAPRNPSPGRER